MATPINNERHDVDKTGWSVSRYNQTASFVYSDEYTAPVLELLSAKPGEKIIDFGCGSGEITLKIEKIVNQEAGGQVVGVDASENMIKKAKINGLRDALVADVQDFDWPRLTDGPPQIFDAVFTNAALHWCKRNPRGVLQSVKRILKPGGRFVGEMGGFLNVVGIRSAIHSVLRAKGVDPGPLDPWYFPSIPEYRELLISESFEPIHLTLTPRITPIQDGLMKWLELFARNSFLKDFNDAESEEILSQVVKLCQVDSQDEMGNWAIVYVRLRFVAILSA